MPTSCPKLIRPHFWQNWYQYPATLIVNPASGETALDWEPVKLDLRSNSAADLLGTLQALSFSFSSSVELGQ